MTDAQFLMWIHERLVHVHGENELVDYPHRLRAIIANTGLYKRSTYCPPQLTAEVLRGSLFSE